jgi:hypothetical protein
MLDFRKLKDSEVALAGALLYRVYVHDLKWRITEGNLSGIVVEDSPIGPLLTDTFSARAKWYGVFIGEELKAVCRLLPREEVGSEVEIYFDIPDFIKKSRRSCELNRLAVSADVDKGAVLIFMLYNLARKVDELQFEYVFMTAQFPEPGNAYVRLGLIKNEGYEFKYDKNDESSVCLAHFDLSDRVALARFYSSCESMLISR